MVRALPIRASSRLQSRFGRAAIMLAVAFVTALGAVRARAAAISVTNPSFEDAGSGIPSWTVTPTGAGTTAPGAPVLLSGEDSNVGIEFAGGYTGSQIGYFYWGGDGGGGAPNPNAHSYGTMTASQTVTGTPALPNKIYTLLVDIGYRDDSAGYNDTLPNPEEIDLKVLAGGVELASPVAVKPSAIYRNFVTYSIYYTTGATVPGGDLQVQIIGDRSSNTGSIVPAGFNPLGHADRGEAFLPFDNVRLDVIPVPEPSAFALVVGGMLVLARRIRRRA